MFTLTFSIAEALSNISPNAQWIQNGVTIAGGQGKGNESNQFSSARGLYVCDDQTIFIAEQDNHRVMEWRPGATTGQVVAGGNENGNRINQLNKPTNVIVDKESDSLIICDRGNRRVIRWPRQCDTTSGEVMIENIDCFALAMDDQRFLYISDGGKHEVRRYPIEEKNGIVVAGGNGPGDCLNQLNSPGYIFVDRDHSVYVSDWLNDRVMKWVKGAKAGIVVAGAQGAGTSLKHVYGPQGVFVDSLGTVYVGDAGNNRVMQWKNGSAQGNVIVGGNGRGQRANQLNYPEGLSFDLQGNLYVVDNGNHRVQRFEIEER
ncbi:unnamed protein product [Rotaria sp. Silwood2]|nr:unnamed protein product [Rotaria sp. Silwood2]CAF4025154.1 unnamed protein product [Rotaria sp. Silwood2]